MFYRFLNDVFQCLFDAFKDLILGEFFFVLRFRSGSCSCCCSCCESCWADAWVGWCIECLAGHCEVFGRVND